MRSTCSFSLLASSIYLASFLDTVYASYGRFPCGSPSGLSVELVADQSKCIDKPYQGATSQCVRISNDDFACGVQGAKCTGGDNCDGGQCFGPFGSSTCVGGPGFRPDGGQPCLGRLSRSNYAGTDVGVCGGTGATCAQQVLVDEDTIFIVNPDDTLCASNYCTPSTGLCGIAPGSPGASCEPSEEDCGGVSSCGPNQDGDNVCGADGTNCYTYAEGPDGGATFPPVDSACVSGYCDPNSLVCAQPAPVPSGRARQRRNQIALARNCPPQQEACSLIGSFGYECVDTQSNIERCGSCDGTDCTELPGVDRVNCSEGSCIILSCADGHRYDEVNKRCILVQEE